jgi:hypothetical protein
MAGAAVGLPRPTAKNTVAGKRTRTSRAAALKEGCEFPEKTLLNRILGILTMSRDAMSNLKHPFAMTFVKLAKESSVAHLGARDERLVAQISGSVRSEIPAASAMR